MIALAGAAQKNFQFFQKVIAVSDPVGLAMRRRFYNRFDYIDDYDCSTLVAHVVYTHFSTALRCEPVYK